MCSEVDGLEYNVEKYIHKCLDSLVAQDYDNFDVLVINDGSPANEQVIIDRFVSEDCRFKGFQKPNGGLSDARNYGIERATGDYFVFIKPCLLDYLTSSDQAH